ncbi:type II toxin-antitoxin system TacA family antitoxin [Patulibacter sp. S7RM1-6]
MSTTGKRTSRINMRVSERQERVLRAAAELSGETLTGFVVAASTDRAEELLERANRIELAADDFERFVGALDAPVEEMPVLRRYARSTGPSR